MATITEAQFAELPHGVKLHYASAGIKGRPLLLFLHGFPEFWYAWQAQLAHFGENFFAVAPDLRGFNLSDQPQEVDAYRPKLLLQDIDTFIRFLGYDDCVIVGHDWGGALAWQFAISYPHRLKRLLIINATHPVPFAEALANDPAQQAASSYMNLLRATDAEQVLGSNDFRELERLMLGMGVRADWFNDAVRSRYHRCWSRGLRGGLNYYRASRVHPPTPDEPGAAVLSLDPAKFRVPLPVRVLWGEQDRAMLPSLLNSLDRFVVDLQIKRVADASHWIIHEQPDNVNRWISTSLEH